MDIIIMVVSVIVLTVVLKGLSLIGSRITKAQQAQILYATAIDTVDDLVDASVGKWEQLVAAELRQQVKIGEANREDLLALANIVYDEVISSLNEKLYAALSGNINDVELYIRNEIESCVLYVKSQLNRERV